jgi:D-3-phosphoglycerate dehydrogenase
MKDQQSRPIVLLTGSVERDALERIQAHADIRMTTATTLDDFVAAARDVDIIVVRAPLPPGLFAHTPRLLATVRHGVGVDLIPVEEASAHGIAVTNVPGSNARGVAEYVVGQVLALTHQIFQADRLVRTTGWSAARERSDFSVEAGGRTVGLIGVGQIGLEVARMCHDGLNMRVVGARRSDAPLPPYIEKVSTDEVFERADVVVLACPLTPETRGLANADRLGRMRPGSYLINVARGAVLDEVALLRELQGGRLAGAALDVFGTQPLPADSPLLQHPNVVATPHFAGGTYESLRVMGMTCAEQITDLLQGRVPRNLVNEDARAAIEARLSRLRAGFARVSVAP